VLDRGGRDFESMVIKESVGTQHYRLSALPRHLCHGTIDLARCRNL